MRSLLAASAAAYLLIAVLLLAMAGTGRGVSTRLSASMAVVSLGFAGLVTAWMLTAG